MPSDTEEGQRMQMGIRAIVPIGLGDIDYKPIFAAAEVAGMKHLCIEQDDASDWEILLRQQLSVTRDSCTS